MAGRSKKEIETTEASQVEVSPKRVIDSNTPVDIMNNTTGKLVYINKRTGAPWRLEGYGAMDEMLVSDLKNMRSSAASLLLEGYLLIMDDDVIEYLRLQDVYKNIIRPEGLNTFFKQNDVKMREILEKCPKGMKELLFDKAKEMIQNNHPDMDYNSKKRVFEDIFKIKFDDILRR